MLPTPDNHALQKLFRGLVENAFFSEIGVCDPELVEYIADLLTKFVHVDHIHLLRDAEGRRIEQLGRILAASLEGASPGELPSEFVVHRYIGDYTLFWAGCFPERLRMDRRRPTWLDGVLDYVAQGKRSYARASDLSDDHCRPPSALLRRLSEEFEACVHGLGLVRKGWEHEETRDSGDLLY